MWVPLATMWGKWRQEVIRSLLAASQVLGSVRDPSQGTKAESNRTGQPLSSFGHRMCKYLINTHAHTLHKQFLKKEPEACYWGVGFWGTCLKFSK